MTFNIHRREVPAAVLLISALLTSSVFPSTEMFFGTWSECHTDRPAESETASHVVVQAFGSVDEYLESDRWRKPASFGQADRWMQTVSDRLNPGKFGADSGKCGHRAAPSMYATMDHPAASPGRWRC